MTEISGRPESYVGVSGVVSPVQQELIEHTAESLGLQTRLNRRLVLGVKAVHKTQYLNTENKYGPTWYPVGAVPFTRALWPRMLDGDSNTLGIAQAYFDPETVGMASYRERFADIIFSRGAPWIDGIQFDLLPWHSGSEELLRFISELKEKYTTRILLQAHEPAMDALGPKGIVKRLGKYAETIDYVLFDASHGTAKKLDVETLSSFLREAYSATALDSTGFAIAGGLSGETVREELPALLDEFPDISWDAEGKLHPPALDGKRPLDFKSVQDYLQASAKVLEKTTRLL